jgi:hypothetical protein
MTVRLVLCAASLFIGMGCVMRGNLLYRKIVDEINRVLPEEKTIDLWGFSRHRLFEALAEHRRLYPDGKLVVRCCIWWAIGFAFWIGTAGCWYIISPRTPGSP